MKKSYNFCFMLNRLGVAVSLLRTATCRRGIALAKRVINCFKLRSNGFEKTENLTKKDDVVKGDYSDRIEVDIKKYEAGLPFKECCTIIVTKEWTPCTS